MQPRIYLDANATTPLLPEVFEAMRPYLLGAFGNASSIHQSGQHARAAVDRARDQVARLLHARSSEIVFTSGGTESDNLALFGILTPGDHLVTSTIEHHAVLHAAQALQARGIEVTYLPCDAQGLISPATLAEALKPNTRLVSIMLANNETGTIQPIAELAALAKAHGAYFHTDAVQAAGKLPLDLGLTCALANPSGSLKDVDLLSISGHKMYAPQGTGVLFVRRHVKLAPLFHGGMHERQRRAGTENVPGIVALGEAAEQARTWLGASSPQPESQNPGAPGCDSETWDGPPRNPTELANLRDTLEQSLLEIPNSGINGAGTPRTPNTSNLYFEGIDADSLLIALDLAGLAVSAGSACQSGATEPSHVLTAMGLPHARAKASIRISLSRQNTRSEIAEATRRMIAAVIRQRAVSTLQL